MRARANTEVFKIRVLPVCQRRVSFSAVSLIRSFKKYLIIKVCSSNQMQEKHISSHLFTFHTLLIEITWQMRRLNFYCRHLDFNRVLLRTIRGLSFGNRFTIPHPVHPVSLTLVAICAEKRKNAAAKEKRQETDRGVLHWVKRPPTARTHTRTHTHQ